MWGVAGFTVDVQHHVVTVLRQLADVPAPLQLHVHGGQLRHAARQRGKERRVQRQFLFAAQLLLDAPQERQAIQRAMSLVQLDHRVKPPQRPQIADVTHKNCSTRFHLAEQLLQHVQQVFHSGEILNHRVEDHGIKPLIAQVLQLVGRGAAQRDIG